MLFIQKNKKIVLFLATFISGLGGTFLYLKHNYTYREQLIESVEIICNSTELSNSVVYLKDTKDVTFNYNKLYKPEKTTDTTLVFDLKEQIQLRNLRLYFNDSVEDGLITKVYLKSKDYSEVLDLKSFKNIGGISIVDYSGGLNFKVEIPNSFFEIEKTYLYPSDINSVVLSFTVIILILLALYIVFNQLKLNLRLDREMVEHISVVVFLGSIFMPHPIFNIGLAISLLFVIKRFSIKHFISNKINLIFIGYFLVLFLNDLFVSPAGYHNLKATETYLPFFILPVYVSCVKDSKSVGLLPFLAVLMGCGLFLTSIINVVIFRNLDYLSFNEFTKFTHPVYYSYLVSFSIFYLFLYSKMENLYKNIIQVLLFCFLILAGSKLVISITIVIYIVLVIRNKKTLILALLGLIILAFFPPVQKRFDEVLNLKDISIVNEKVISDKSDPRINGLTLRFLLWQESVKSINTVPEYLLGLGVGNTTNDVLKANLTNRGLGYYKRYSTHNQFVNVFMRAGLVGVLSLLMIIVYGFYKAIKNKNKMLLIMLIMFTFAMLTESVLQRILGIYFFTTILLFLMKPNFLNETSIVNDSQTDNS